VETLRYPWERLEQLIGDRMGSRLAIALRCAQRYRPTVWFWCRSNSHLTNNHAPRTIGDRFSGRPNERPTTCSSAVCRARLFQSPQRIKHDSSATSALLEAGQIIAGFADLPPKPPRSKLEPHRDLIRELRRKGQTYRDVARLFQERLGLYVAPSTLHSFVKVRAKHRKRSQFELPPMELAASEVSPVLDRVVALQSRPTASNAKPARFVFRENEPLPLTNNGGEQ
jgi:hypothetical protein